MEDPLNRQLSQLMGHPLGHSAAVPPPTSHPLIAQAHPKHPESQGLFFFFFFSIQYSLLFYFILVFNSLLFFFFSIQYSLLFFFLVFNTVFYFFIFYFLVGPILKCQHNQGLRDIRGSIQHRERETHENKQKNKTERKQTP